jgi:hypothetical protein
LKKEKKKKNLTFIGTDVSSGGRSGGREAGSPSVTHGKGGGTEKSEIQRREREYA